MIRTTSPPFFLFFSSFFFSFTFEGSQASRRVFGISCSTLLSHCWKSEPVRSHDTTGGWDLEREKRHSISACTAILYFEPYHIFLATFYSRSVSTFQVAFFFVFWIALPFFCFFLLLLVFEFERLTLLVFESFLPPDYTSRLQVFSMQLFWSRVPTAYDRSHLLASFVSRVERLLSAFREFFTECLMVALTHFNSFLFFAPLFLFCRLLLLLCFGLPFAVLCLAVEFCDFDVSVASANQTFAFTLFSLSIMQKETFFIIKSPQWRFNVTLFLQSITQVCCVFFPPLLFSYVFAILLLLVTLSSLFGQFSFS